MSLWFQINRRTSSSLPFPFILSPFSLHRFLLISISLYPFLIFTQASEIDVIRDIFIYRSIGLKTVYEHSYLIGGDFGYYRTLAWWLMTLWHCILQSHFSLGKREHSMCTKEQTQILTCATESTQKTALVYIVPLQENHFVFSTCWGSNPLQAKVKLFLSLKLMSKHKFGQAQCNLRKKLH